MVCQKCGSHKIQKYGTRKVKRGGHVVRVQAYRCYNCLSQWVAKG